MTMQEALAHPDQIGNYKIIAPLGEGGMGFVYKAENILLQRTVALKILHPERVVRPEVVRRFFNEARAVNKIRHPNIIDIFDFSMTDDGRPYFVMEFLEGRSLSQELEQKGALPIAQSLHIFRQIASALDACHKVSVIHRDLKPENILLLQHENDPDFAKVLDFGIAKLQDETMIQSAQKTNTGVVLGTPAYMSPEQAGGESLDPRTDIYSTGLILYEMLTGSQPFLADSAGYLIAKILTEPIPSPRLKNPAISPLLEAVVLKALQKKRDDRFSSIQDFLLAIDEVIAGGGGTELSAQQQKLFSVRNQSRTTLSSRKRSKPRRTLSLVVIGVASLLGSVVLLSFLSSSQPQSPSQPQPSTTSALLVYPEAPASTPTSAPTTDELNVSADEEIHPQKEKKKKRKELLEFDPKKGTGELMKFEPKPEQ
jgi:serine/threonine protein kinase